MSAFDAGKAREELVRQLREEAERWRQEKHAYCGPDEGLWPLKARACIFGEAADVLEKAPLAPGTGPGRYHSAMMDAFLNERGYGWGSNWPDDVQEATFIRVFRWLLKALDAQEEAAKAAEGKGNAP